MVNMFPGVPAQCLCDKHLNSVLAEYNNLLMPAMRKGKSIRGYVLHGCVDLRTMVERVNKCIAETKIRGFSWKYLNPSTEDEKLIRGYCIQYCFTAGDQIEMAEMNKRILAFRCPECRGRIMKEMKGE